MKKPIRTADGYTCPVCQKFSHEYAIQIYRHMQLAHGEKTKQKKAKKVYENVSRETFNEKQCCDFPKYRLLNERVRLEERALAAGFNEVCAQCGELRT